MMEVKVKVINPLKICHWQLEVGDEFGTADWNITKLGTFFRPLGVKGMSEGMSWMFTRKNFEITLDGQPFLV
tara:strand:+ start:2048 stop:2263 length:216 start_codon:yes stop_codon:yes gene_type:complete